MKNPVTTFLLVGILVNAVFCQSFVLAADEKSDAEEAPAVLTPVEKKMLQKVSLDFRETPIEDVLLMLSKQADVDIVKSPAVTGQVTATLTDIPLGEALDNILAAHGAGYIATANMIRVVPRAEIYNVPEKIVNKVYRITYADVKEVEKALGKFMTSSGSMSAMPGTSNIIVKDTESTIEAIDKFIEEVDRVTQQVLVEVRIYDVMDTEDFNLEVDWIIGRNTPITDIERTVVEGSTTSDETTKTTEDTWLRTTNSRSKPFVGGTYDNTDGGSLSIGLLNDAIDLEFVLKMLHKQDWATLLANPSIMVLDNETATFEIIEEIPYKEESSTSGGGQLTSTRFKDVGVKLKVTPHITRDDMLRLHLMPEFSVPEQQEKNPITNEPIVPTVNTRRLDTIALLKNGETVVLGGLRKQKITKDIAKVPLLGDLPLLGGLFRSENENTETTEVLVFITPKVVDIPVMKADQADTFNHTDIRKVYSPKLKHTGKQKLK